MNHYRDIKANDPRNEMKNAETAGAKRYPSFGLLLLGLIILIKWTLLPK